MGMVIRQTEPQLWTIGVYDDAGNWYPHHDYGDKSVAEAWCAYLNGGPHPDSLTGELVARVEILRIAALQAAAARLQGVDVPGLGPNARHRGAAIAEQLVEVAAALERYLRGNWSGAR